MRKIIGILALILTANGLFAQTVFDKYEKDENVTSFIAGKKTFAMLAQAQFNSEDEKIKKGKELLSTVDKIQVYNTQKQTVAADMKATVAAYAKSAGMEELMQVKSAGKTISLMVKQGASENIVTQVLAFIGNTSPKAAKNETIIILVSGTFNLDDFSEMLTDKTVTGDKKTDDAKLAEIKEALELKVSPNPATGHFYINTDKPAEVRMYDLSGRLVKQQTYSSAGISVADLTPATYIVEITSGDMRQTQQILIK